MGNFYKAGFFILLFAFIGAGAFYLGQNKKIYEKKTSSETFSTTAPSPKEDKVVVKANISPAVTEKPQFSREYLEENIRAAVISKNYAALEGYMTDQVAVVLESTECCGLVSKTDAVKQMDYLNSATPPWNFDKSNPIALKLRANDPADYGPDDSVIGIASNEYVAAFKLNSENKIYAVTMSVSYKLVAP